MEQWEHAIEVFEVVFQKRQSLVLWWELLVDSAFEDVLENIRTPLYPLIVFYRGCRDHVLKGIVARLLVHPLDAFGRENRET